MIYTESSTLTTEGERIFLDDVEVYPGGDCPCCGNVVFVPVDLVVDAWEQPYVEQHELTCVGWQLDRQAKRPTRSLTPSR